MRPIALESPCALQLVSGILRAPLLPPCYAVVEIYMSKGMAEEDARDVVRKMAKYREFFVNIMMVEELGLKTEDQTAGSAAKGAVMFTAFVAGGLVPILGYVATAYAFAAPKSHNFMLVAASVVTSVALGLLGAFKAYFANRKYLRSALETLVLGGMCAAVSYTVGAAIASLFEVQAA